jgi:hypothetical protein
MPTESATLYHVTYESAEPDYLVGLEDRGDGGKLCGTYAEAIHTIAADAYAKHLHHKCNGNAEDAEAYADTYRIVQGDSVRASAAGPRTTDPEADDTAYWATVGTDGSVYVVRSITEGSPYPCECGNPGRVTAIHKDRNGTQFDAFATCDACHAEHTCATCGQDAWTCAAHHGDTHSANAHH